jgi:nucleotide-binding universal stress UspA family protein
MRAYRKIMVAVDFSEHSMASVSHGARLARDLGAELLLVNIINQRDVDMLKEVALKAPEFSFKEHLQGIEEDREERFRQIILKPECVGIKIDTVVRIGVPFEELLKTIAARHVDLLVMGAKGRSNLVGVVVGSCAQKLFRRCPVPVLSIR